MAKLLLVFVIGLVALQVVTPAAIKNSNSRKGLEDAVKQLTPMLKNTFGASDEILGMIQQTVDLTSDIAEHMDRLFPTFEFKYREVVESLSYNKKLNALIEEVYNLFEGNDECTNIGITELRFIDYLVYNHVGICENENIQQVEAHFIKLRVLQQRLTKLVPEMLHAVYNCKNESNGDNDQFEKCLKSKAEVLRTKVDEVEKDATETKDQEENVLVDAIAKFEECSLSYEAEFDQEAQQIVTDVKTCVQK